MRTERWLRKKDITGLNDTQKQNRTKALGLLNAYWKKEIFPKNTTHQCKIPQIIDQSKTMCAVAFILHNSGHQNIIKEIAQQDNYAYVEDIPDCHPLIQSLKESGISKKEAARIQPTYGSCIPPTSLPDSYGATQIVEPMIAVLVSLAVLVIATAIPIYLRTTGSNFRPIPIALIVGITVAGTVGFALFAQSSEIFQSDGKNSLQNMPDYKGVKGVYPIDGVHSLVYWIDNGKVTKIMLDRNAASIVIGITTSGDGDLTIVLPRSIIDSRVGSSVYVGEDIDFFVLVNGEEVNFEETSTSKDRTLTIPFEEGASQIEIIGQCFYG